jgi:hypothetical protein
MPDERERVYSKNCMKHDDRGDVPDSGFELLHSVPLNKRQHTPGWRHVQLSISTPACELAIARVFISSTHSTWPRWWIALYEHPVKVQVPQNVPPSWSMRGVR